MPKKPGTAFCLITLICVLSFPALALDRQAFTFTSYDLQVRVIPVSQGLEARGKIMLRNDSASPQKNAVLQISSTLDWQSIQVAGKTVTFTSHPYTSDIDHTGMLSEAIVTLPVAVAPKASVELEVTYGGTIQADATRLTRIGTPEKIAARNDWDRISEDFSAVRGAGYVAWYPVVMDPANLSEGNSLSQVLGDWKMRHAASTMKLNLIVEADKSAVTNGKLVSQKADAPKTAEGSPRRQFEFLFSPMGLSPPSFALGDYTVLNRPAISLWYLPGHQGSAADYALAAEKLVPFITEWFGPAHEKVQVVELAEPDAVPFESGSMLFTPLLKSNQKATEMVMAHQLVHACIQTPRPWIAEGLAHFAMVLEREQQDGRKSALAYMDTYRAPLVEAEKQSLAIPAEAGTIKGQPLVRATDEIFYRSKAMFVWWMLRDMIGDQALQRAIQSYRSDQDKDASYMQRLVEAESKRQLGWFFDDWVYRDRGLPDFRVESAYPRSMLPNDYSVTVTVENLGDAGAEVPVVVSAEGGDKVKRVEVLAKSKAVARLQMPAAPTKVTVNNGSVPESDVGNNALEMGK